MRAALVMLPFGTHSTTLSERGTPIMLNSSVLSDAMNARERAMGELRTLNKRGIRTDADRSKESALLSDIEKYDSVVAAEVRRGAALEISREYGGSVYFPTDGIARRALDDAKLLGVKLSNVGEFTLRSADVVEDTHSHEPVNVMLSAAPNGSKLLGKVNAFPFNKARGFLPVAPVVSAELQPRNGAIVDASTAVTISSFDTVKPAAYVVIDRDELQDYPFAEGAINAALLGAVGRAADKVIVAGGTDGDITVPGMLNFGTETVAAAAISVGDVLDAVARIEDASGNASALIMAPTAKAKFTAAAASANVLDRLPEMISIPGAFTDGSVIAADMSQVAVSLRSNLELFKSIDEPTLWGYDKVALAARARLSGVALPDAALVQIVKPGA